MPAPTSISEPIVASALRATKTALTDWVVLRISSAESRRKWNG